MVYADGTALQPPKQANQKINRCFSVLHKNKHLTRG